MFDLLLLVVVAVTFCTWIPSAIIYSLDPTHQYAKRCTLHPCFILAAPGSVNASQIVATTKDGTAVVQNPVLGKRTDWANARQKCRGVFVSRAYKVLPYCENMKDLGGPAELASYVNRPGMRTWRMGPSDAGYESQCGVLGTITTKAELYSTFVDVFDHSKGFFKGTFGDFIPVRGARCFGVRVRVRARARARLTICI
jgi:hypothetical protein